MKKTKILILSLLLAFSLLAFVACGKETYTITYNLDGGTVATANPTTYHAESEEFTLNNPTKEGCDFTGWTYEGQAVPTKTVTIAKGSTGDKTFTANWLLVTGGLEYTLLTDGTYEVKSMGSASSQNKIIIPKTHQGKNVTSIGEHAFKSDESIYEITIPNTVTNIGAFAFEYCTNLKVVTFEDNSQLKTIGANSFFNCRSMTTFAIPSAVTEIGESAFSLCKELTSVVIPSSVTSIGKSAFLQNHKLESVVFGENSQLTTLEEEIFEDCLSLNEIEIPNSVTEIKKYAFFNNISVTSIVIPSSVQIIEEHAFGNCGRLVEVYNLTTIPFSKGSPENGSIAFYALDIYSDITTASKLSTDSEGFVVRTEGEDKTLITYVGDKTEIVLPNDIDSINAHAFYNMSVLTSVTIPSNVTKIFNDAFFDLKSITSVVFENTSGWYKSQSGDLSQAEALDVSSPSTNATNFNIKNFGYIIFAKT